MFICAARNESISAVPGYAILRRAVVQLYTPYHLTVFEVPLSLPRGSLQAVIIADSTVRASRRRSSQTEPERGHAGCLVATSVRTVRERRVTHAERCAAYWSAECCRLGEMFAATKSSATTSRFAWRSSRRTTARRTTRILWLFGLRLYLQLRERKGLQCRFEILLRGRVRTRCCKRYLLDIGTFAGGSIGFVQMRGKRVLISVGRASGPLPY